MDHTIPMMACVGPPLHSQPSAASGPMLPELEMRQGRRPTWGQSGRRWRPAAGTRRLYLESNNYTTFHARRPMTMMMGRETSNTRRVSRNSSLGDGGPPPPPVSLT